MIKRYTLRSIHKALSSGQDLEMPDCDVIAETDYDALAADRDQISLTLDVAKADRDKWFNRAKALEADKADLLRVLGVADERVKVLEAALQGIAKLGGLTLLGGCGMEADRAYELGAHNAFGQAAEMASAALETGTEQALCEDCPPADYPTDATRCAPCPRRMPRR